MDVFDGIVVMVLCLECVMIEFVEFEFLWDCL